MGVFLKFLLSKSKKSLWFVAVGLLATSSVNANVLVLPISGNRTSTVDFNGTAQDLNITEAGSITVDNNFTSVYTDMLNNHFILNDGNISTTFENNDSYAAAHGIDTKDLNSSDITNNGNISVIGRSNNYSVFATGILNQEFILSSNITNNQNIIVNAKSDTNETLASGIGAANLIYSNITNSGNITLNAESSNLAFALGISTFGVGYSNIINDGNITATANSNSDIATAKGIYANNIYASAIINNESINAIADSNDSGARADGIAIDYNVTESNITNNGNIIATAESNGSAFGARADGIYVDGNITDSSITNSKNITVTAENNSSEAAAYGISAYNGLANSNIVNSGDISTTAKSNSSDDAIAYGILTVFSSNVTDSNITNNGNINATAEDDNSWAEAYGISTNNLTYSNITNSGDITVNAKSNSIYASTYGYGMFIGDFTNSNMTNSGTITATAENNGDAKAYGVSASYLENSNMTNSGTITAKINNDFDKSGYAIYVSGSDLNSTITNTETGKLYGNIYINGNEEVINKGLIALPYNANGINNMILDSIVPRAVSIPTNAYIGGNLTNTGTIQIGMLTDGNISNTQYSQLKVGGTATFDPGSVLDVNVLAASTNTNLLVGETLYNVVSSDTNLTVNELTVTDNSSLLNFNYFLVENSIDLNITEGSTILESTIQGGGNQDAQSGAKELDNIQDEGVPSAMDNFYGKLNALGTDKEVAKAVDETVPYTGVSNIGASNAIVDNLFGILEKQGAGGLNSGDKLFGEKRVWIKPFGNIGKQKDKNGIHGFDFNTAGIGIGVDGEYSDNAYAGISFFYNRANVNANGVDQGSDLDVYSAAIYGRTPIANGEARFRYKASASWQKTDSSRYIALTNETAKASYTSNMYAVDLRFEKYMKSYNNILLEPMVGATYKYIHSPSYTENGSSANLSVNSSNTKRLTTYIGTKAYYPLDETSKLYGKINLGYDVVNDDISIISAYSASPNNKFTTNGIDNGRWSYLAAVGYRKHISNQDDIDFRYEYSGEGSSYYNNTFFLNYSHKF